MGAYLRKPLTEKSSTHGERTVGDWRLRYAATAMQGWRISMEDAHSIIPELDDQTSLFAVYDGHGGKEVALYCALHLPKLVQSCEPYKKKDLEQALRDTFMLCDRQLLSKEAIDEMKSLLLEEGDSTREEESSSDEQEEATKLMQDAEVPLETILAQYRMLGRKLIKEEIKDGSSEIEGRPDTGAESGSWLFLQLLGGEINEDLDSSEEEVEEGEKQEEEEAGEKEEEEKEEEERKEEEMDTEKGESVGGEDEVILSVNHDAKASHESGEDSTKSSCQNAVRKRGSSRMLSNAKIKQASSAADSCNAKPEQSPPEISTSTSPTNCNERKDTSQVSTDVQSCMAESCPTSSNFDDSVKAPPTTDVTSKSDSDPSAGSTTKGRRLLDLLTSSVEDRSPRTPVLETHEELTSCEASTKRNQSAVMELPPISPFVRMSRKRPRSEEDDHQMNALDAKRLCRPVTDDQGYHSGTTAVLCLLRGNKLVVANAGDSRCVLSNKGVAVDMSLDHKPTDLPELERIKRAGGQVGVDARVNGGLNLSRAIGDHFYKENKSLPLEEQMITAMPDIQTRVLTDDDEFFVVACDGIWNSKSSQEVVDFVHKRLAESTHEPKDLATICEALCDACLAPDTNNDGTGCDNMTCMIVLLSHASS